MEQNPFSKKRIYYNVHRCLTFGIDAELRAAEEEVWASPPANIFLGVFKNYKEVWDPCNFPDNWQNTFSLKHLDDPRYRP